MPDMPEALVGDGRVDDRIGDRPVPHEGLQRRGINAAPRKGITRPSAVACGHGSEMAAWRPRQAAQ